MQENIARLQAEAEAFRRTEVAGVIAKIKDDIRTYGLAPHDLFGKSAVKSELKSAKANPAKVKGPADIKYTDGAGNFWVGRGKRPKWLNEALNAGKKLEDYLFGSPAATAAKPAAAPAPTPAPAPAPKASAKAAVKQSPAKRAPAKKVAAKKAAAKKAQAQAS
jgi:DNA-binding protein H-NS